MCQKSTQGLCICLSAQIKLIRKSCLKVTGATISPAPARQSPKIFQ